MLSECKQEAKINCDNMTIAIDLIKKWNENKNVEITYISIDCPVDQIVVHFYYNYVIH